MGDEMIVGIDASNLLEGGGITHLVELLTAADPPAQGIEKVVVWAPSAAIARLPTRPWLTTVILPELGKFARATWQRFKLAREARGYECDLLFVPGGSYVGSFRPFVTMSRNMLPFDSKEVARYGLSVKRIRLELLRLIQGRSFAKAQGLIFLTDYARRNVLSSLRGLPRRIATIPHGVSRDFAVLDRKAREIDECTSSDPFRMIYVSHASPYKHQWFVVEAVADLRARTGWPLRLDMVGPCSVRESVERIRLARERFDPCDEWAFFHGAASRERVREFLRNADLGVFASSCENMPNILLEKMAAGLPVAASMRGPMPEVLGDAGKYFEPEDVRNLSEVIEHLVRDCEVRQHLSAEAALRAMEFDWGRCANDTLGFLSSVFESCSREGVGRRT